MRRCENQAMKTWYRRLITLLSTLVVCASLGLVAPGVCLATPALAQPAGPLLPRHTFLTIAPSGNALSPGDGMRRAGPLSLKRILNPHFPLLSPRVSGAEIPRLAAQSLPRSTLNSGSLCCDTIGNANGIHRHRSPHCPSAVRSR